MRVVEVRGHLGRPVGVDRARPRLDPQLVALAQVAAVGHALDHPAVLGDPVGLELVPRLLLELLESRLELCRR